MQLRPPDNWNNNNRGPRIPITERDMQITQNVAAGLVTVGNVVASAALLSPEVNAAITTVLTTHSPLETATLISNLNIAPTVLALGTLMVRLVPRALEAYSVIFGIKSIDEYNDELTQAFSRADLLIPAMVISELGYTLVRNMVG